MNIKTTLIYRTNQFKSYISNLQNPKPCQSLIFLGKIQLTKIIAKTSHHSETTARRHQGERTAWCLKKMKTVSLRTSINRKRHAQEVKSPVRCSKGTQLCKQKSRGRGTQGRKSSVQRVQWSRLFEERCSESAGLRTFIQVFRCFI
jgi:hypothetical protein